MGFRNALLLAFALLSVGYLSLALFPLALEQNGLVEYGRKVTFTGLMETDVRWLIVPIMVVIMIGGSFIKAVITGTVATTTTTANRAKGFAIFYMMVNMGAFSDKTIVKSMNQILTALWKVLSNGRLIALILIINGFWMVQHQLYATMPKYVLRMSG